MRVYTHRLCSIYRGGTLILKFRDTNSRGRPDKDDLHHAKEFGQKIREKLQSVPSISQVSDVHVPGTYPYGGVTKLWAVDFIAVSDECTSVGPVQRCARLVLLIRKIPV